MKYLFVFSCLLSMFISCSPKELPTIFENTDDKIVVKLSHQTTKAEIDNIIAELKAKKIQMDVTGSKFFDDNKLRSLKLTAMWPDGTVGNIAADLMNLQFKYCGFVYDRNGSPMLQFAQFE